MNDKKRFPDERPEDVNKVLNDSLSDIGFINHIISSITGFAEEPTVVYHVDPESFKRFLEGIAKSLELLSGYITEELEPEVEALSGDLTSSYETNRELDYENKRLKSENQYLRDDKFRVVMDCTERDKKIKKLKSENQYLRDARLRAVLKNIKYGKENDELNEKLKRMSDANHNLYNRLENSEKMLKSAVTRIDDLYKRLTDVQNHAGVFTYKAYDDEYTKNKETKNSLYGICAKCVIRLNPVNNGSNFCGNCRYCVQLMTGEYACRIPIPDRIIDPDDSSCQYFKEPYDTRTDQEVCAECDKKDTEHCKKCPLFPF